MVSDASACSGALEAVRNETALFDRYVREKGTSNEETFTAACLETQKVIDRLPSDYDLSGPERSARLWRVRNTYRFYVNVRNLIIDLYDKGDEDVSLLYDVYGMIRQLILAKQSRNQLFFNDPFTHFYISEITAQDVTDLHFS